MLITMAVLFACGVYLMLEKSMTRVLLGFLLVGNATNLLILSMAGVPGGAPIADGAGGATTDPLPQALALTAIVITFGVSAFLLALIYRSWKLGRPDEVEVDEADVAVRTEGVPEEEIDGDTRAGDSEFADETGGADAVPDSDEEGEPDDGDGLDSAGHEPDGSASDSRSTTTEGTTR
nr:Na(+)/H(+) antiporter subunit C [Schumannella luteola]